MRRGTPTLHADYSDVTGQKKVCVYLMFFTFSILWAHCVLAYIITELTHLRLSCTLFPLTESEEIFENICYCILGYKYTCITM